MIRMSFIKLDTLARDHSKKYKLAQALGESDAAAFGYMCALWSWAADFCPDGNLSQFPDYLVASRCDYRGEPSKFILALKSVHLLDESGIIHDWDEHIGGDILSLAERDAKRRWSDAERQRRSRYNKKLKALGLPPLERGAPVPDTDPVKPCSNSVTESRDASRDCERDVYIDKEKDKELEGNDTVVAPAPVFISEDNPRARAYTREEPVTRKRDVDPVTPERDADPVTPERDADPVTPERDAEPVTKKRDAKEKAIAAAIRGQVVKALDEVIQDTEASEKAADFLISNAQTDYQLERVTQIARLRVMNRAARNDPVRHPYDYVTAILNRAKAFGLKTKAEFDLDTACFGSNWDDFDTG